MTDVTEWIKERRRIHGAATPGKWEDRLDDLTDEMRVVQEHEYVREIAWTGEVFGEYDRVNAVAIADAHNTLPALLTALEKVLGLHKPFEWSFGYGPVYSCEECSRLGGNPGKEDEAEWPCPTVQTIERVIND